MIQADAATNSLIITAPSNIYNNMRAVIDVVRQSLMPLPVAAEVEHFVARQMTLENTGITVLGLYEAGGADSFERIRAWLGREHAIHAGGLGDDLHVLLRHGLSLIS